MTEPPDEPTTNGSEPPKPTRRTPPKPGTAKKKPRAPRKPNAAGPPPAAKSNGEEPPEEPPAKGGLEVDLPAGGRLRLNDSEEVVAWEQSAKRYIDDYGLTKANDLMLLGAILSQGLMMYRAQRNLADDKVAVVNAAQGQITKAAAEIRELEKALGIDKKTREAGGQHTVIDYITRLKRAAHSKGVHLSERMKRYEAFNMDLRWKIRLLRNGDDEDRRHHGISESSILTWAEAELGKLEEADKTWAHEQGKVFAGRL